MSSIVGNNQRPIQNGLFAFGRPDTMALGHMRHVAFIPFEPLATMKDL